MNKNAHVGFDYLLEKDLEVFTCDLKIESTCKKLKIEWVSEQKKAVERVEVEEM